MAYTTFTAKQVAEMVNGATSEFLGESEVLQEDLTNVVDIGKAIQNANAYKNFLNNMALRIGMVIFADRVYTSKAPNVYRNTFEYGQIVEKVRTKLPKAQKSQAWELEDGTSYDDNVFIKDEVIVKLFANEDVFEIRKSVTNDQIKNAFTSATQLGSFVSMMFNHVENSIKVKLDSLIYATIANFMGEHIHAGKQVKLLTKFNALNPSKQLTASTALYDTDFLKFATGEMKQIKDDLAHYSTLYNLEGLENFTEEKDLHVVLLSKFINNVDTYLQSDTFHNDFVKLPRHEVVPYWQGSGTTIDDIESRSKINITTASGHTVEKSGIIGVMFDHDALGITRYEPTVETKYVKSGRFTNYWFGERVSYFNDLSENAVVFTLD